MEVTIVADLQQIDWDATFAKVKIAENLQTVKASHPILLVDEAQITNLPSEKENLYLPVRRLNESAEGMKGFVYFDLALYPFFQEARKIILNSEQLQGVFRLRRTFAHDVNEEQIAGDLFVLEKIFGDAKQIHVKHSRKEKKPYHVIVTVNYGNGTMAHLDYTFNDTFRIEVEWSGIGKIIEFNSSESSPIIPAKSTGVPLAYRVEAIIEHAEAIDTQLVENLSKYKVALKGVGNK